MRASPAIQVSLTQFGVWRSAVWLVAIAGILALLAWARAPRLAPDAPAWLAAAAAAIAVSSFAVGLTRVPAARLSWDGRTWNLSRGRAAGSATVAGELTVAIDLGLWMLLRFEPGPPDARRRASWLPAQRKGMEGQWHALRCAVHSTQPAPGDESAPR